MPNPNDTQPHEPSMLDDLLATDGVLPPLPVSLKDETGIDGRFDGPEVTVPDGLTALDLRHLNAGDWSVIIATLMRRLGIDLTTLTDLERQGATAAEAGQSLVLVASFDPSNADLCLSLQSTKSSEFRS